MIFSVAKETLSFWASNCHTDATLVTNDGMCLRFSKKLCLRIADIQNSTTWHNRNTKATALDSMRLFSSSQTHLQREPSLCAWKISWLFCDTSTYHSEKTCVQHRSINSRAQDFLTSSSLNQYNNIYQIRVIVNCAVKVAYPQISSRQLPHFEVPPDASFAFLSIAAGTAPPSCGGSLAWSSRSPRLDQSRKIHVFGKHFVRYASVFVLVVICCNMLQGNHLYFQEWCWQQPGLFNSLSCP